LSLPALALYWGSLPNYGCPPIRGRVPGLPIVLPGWGDPCTNFWGSGALVFWGFWVRCGRVKLVSKSLGPVWGLVPNYGCLPISGGYRDTHSLTRLGRPMHQFLGVRCGSYFWFWVRCCRVKLVSKSLGPVWGFSAELRMPTHKGRVPGYP